MDYLRKASEYIVYLGALFVYRVMAYISSSVPLAGDDWGYALNADNLNPFVRAYEFYFTWSGRFFAELYGFIVAPNKELWNVLNPILFALLFCFIIALVAKKNRIICGLVLIALMFSVDRVLRIETYSWLMGTTYVIPLVLTLLYFNLIRPFVLENKKLSTPRIIVCCLLNFYITLSMENIAAMLVVANVLLFGYWIYENKTWKHPFIAILITSIIGLCLLRLSPGATYRTLNEHANFIEMGLFNQIATNWNYFLMRTFIDNKYMMFAFSLILGISVFMKGLKSKNKMFYFLSAVQGITLVASVSDKLYEITNINLFLVLYDIEYTQSALVIMSLFYIFYIIITMISLFLLGDTKQERAESIFYLLMAGGANIVMFISPIFGARSSLYTVYFIFVLTVYLLSKIEIHKSITIVLSLSLIYFIHGRYQDLYYKYELVAIKDEERMVIIEYYQDHQDDLNVWIPRMPEGLVHSADIEEGDDYHFEVFKQYYGINPEATVTFSHDVGK